MIHHSPPKPIVVTCAPQTATYQSPLLAEFYAWSCSTIIKGKKVHVLVLFQEPDNLVVSPPIPNVKTKLPTLEGGQ